MVGESTVLIIPEKIEGKIGGTYTMNAKQAAELINEIQPETAIPVHYGSVVGGKADEETFVANVKEPVKVEIKLDV